MLTESTRSKDVFPAFWSPIIVTSISVALCTLSVLAGEPRLLDRVSGLPECPEQPVVHFPE
jgi:hypothetical protein